MPTTLYLPLALIAFAANSFFCRFALSEQSIDPGSFTLIRLLSGAVTLMVLMQLKGQFNLTFLRNKNSWLAGGTLFGYAVAFSYAYTSLTTGTGALILFGVVQLTLIGAHLLSGQRLGYLEWLGIGLSISGFVVLMMPSAQAPEWDVAFLMAMSGVCWAMFTLLGKRSPGSASTSITHGFVIASLLAVLALPWLTQSLNISGTGVVWALMSGVVASGLGYIIWYQVMKSISVLQASVAQLSVPVIAFIVGAIGLGEEIQLISVLASILVLGGIGLVFISKR